MQKIIYLFCLIFSVSIVSAQEICHITVEYPNWGGHFISEHHRMYYGKNARRHCINKQWKILL